MRRSFLDCLLRLVQDYDGSESTLAGGGRAVASQEALKVLIGSIDVLYPTERSQALLLSSYLRAYDANGGYSSTPAEGTLPLELLARASTVTFLQKLKDSNRGPCSSVKWPEAQLTANRELESQGATSLAPEVNGNLTKVLIDL